MILNKYSQAVTQDPTQPAAKAMLHAIGLSSEDLTKPFVGVASTGYEGNPCNIVAPIPGPSWQPQRASVTQRRLQTGDYTSSTCY